MATTARHMFRNSRDSRWGPPTLIGNHPLILTKCNSSRVFHLHGVHDWVNHYGLYVSRICPVCHNYNPVRSSFMTNHRVCNKSNTMDAISGAGTAYPS
jgi:hypothetical protein